MKTNFVFLLIASLFCGACNNNPASNSTANAADTAKNNGYTDKPDAIKENNSAPPMTAALAGISDTDFLTQAYNTGVFEIKAARLVRRMSEDRKVKEFADTVIADHLLMDKYIAELMQKKGYTIPADLPVDLKNIYKDLNERMGTDLDKKYAEVNMKGHKDAIALFTRVSKGSKDPEVKQLAIDDLPRLRHHEELAEALQNHLNAK